MKLNSKRDILREIVKAVVGKDERVIVNDDLNVHFNNTLLGIGDEYVQQIAASYVDSGDDVTASDVQCIIINALITLYWQAEYYDNACS